ncbi:MAG: hypothetical protein LUD01_01465 [Clostridiales bacterium]|nr:hypothetical protein [Clostridiales bacterium]
MGRKNYRLMTNEEFEKERQRYEKRLEQARRKKEIYDQRQQIYEIKKEMRRFRPPTTTKILMAWIFGNCTAVEIYSMAVMYLLQDLSSLYALITAVIGETISFAVYAAKAYNETKQEEAVKLERDKQSELINFQKYKLENGYAETEEDTEPDREAAMG